MLSQEKGHLYLFLCEPEPQLSLLFEGICMLKTTNMLISMVINREGSLRFIFIVRAACKLIAVSLPKFKWNSFSSSLYRAGTSS